MIRRSLSALGFIVKLGIVLIMVASCSTMETSESLYADAVRDSVFADEDEIMPLVMVERGSDMVTWDDGRVLMLSWHRHPERYVPGEIYVSDDVIWVFTDREILAWYGEKGWKADDMILRLEQLIGLPEDSGYTHVSAFWCDPDDLIRPAYQTDITKEVTPDLLDGSALGEHKAWFDGNIIWSYFDSAYPWTRLGYTYDWDAGNDEYGLSEFIILPGSAIEVAWTKETDEFIGWMAE